MYLTQWVITVKSEQFITSKAISVQSSEAMYGRAQAIWLSYKYEDVIGGGELDKAQVSSHTDSSDIQI